jgi:hypothetical protein
MIQMLQEKVKRKVLLMRIVADRLPTTGNAVVAQNRDSPSIQPRNKVERTRSVQQGEERPFHTFVMLVFVGVTGRRGQGAGLTADSKIEAKPHQQINSIWGLKLGEITTVCRNRQCQCRGSTGAPVWILLAPHFSEATTGAGMTYQPYGHLPRKTVDTVN